MNVAVKKFEEGLHTGTLPPSMTKTKPKEFLSSSQTRFTPEDVDKLEFYLDNALKDSSLASE